LSSSPSDDTPDLASRLFRELHHLAVAKMRFQRGNHALQLKAFVNEAYAHAHRAEKRGDGQVRVTLFEGRIEATCNSKADVLAVDEALNRFTEFDLRKASIVERHSSGGLTFDEIALELDISSRIVKRDWTMTCAWLRRELSPERYDS
jgi:hypothetical protein